MTHPPSGPTTPPPPSGPKADDAIFAAAEQLRADLMPPARRDLSPIDCGGQVATPGGPGTCGHCGRLAAGYAAISRIDGDGPVRLCHRDVGRDCYRLVTVYGHPMPCELCAEPRFSLPQPPSFRVGAS